MKVKVSQSVCDPTDYTVHGILQARILKWVTFPSSGDLPNPGIELRSPWALHVDSLPAEPQEKPKNMGVGSLSLLLQIFPTKESNWGLLNYRRILSQLSYQESQVIKDLPINAGDVKDMGASLGWKDSLKKGMTTHSSILA